MRIKLIFLLLFPFLWSCGLGTVKWSAKDLDFQQENFPMREIRVIAFMDGSHSQEQADQAIAKSNKRFMEQAGVQLKVIEWQQVKWPFFKTWNGMLEVMEKRLKEKDFDIAIAFTSYNVLGFLWSNVGFYGKMAAVEDTYRRYIIIKELSSFILEHEVWHCFLFDITHTWTGLLMPFNVRLLPLTPAVPIGGRYLTAEARKEILKNKWRDFSKPMSYYQTRPQHATVDRSNATHTDYDKGMTGLSVK
jgi:hypothetical protein